MCVEGASEGGIAGSESPGGVRPRGKEKESFKELHLDGVSGGHLGKLGRRIRAYLTPVSMRTAPPHR